MIKKLNKKEKKKKKKKKIGFKSRTPHTVLIIIQCTSPKLVSRLRYIVRNLKRAATAGTKKFL